MIKRTLLVVAVLVTWCAAQNPHPPATSEPAGAPPDLLSSRTPMVDVRAYGAKGDGLTNDSTAIQNAIRAAGSGIVLLPQGYTFAACGLVMPVYGKISGYGAKLVPSGSRCTILSENSQAQFNSSDKPGIFGLTIDCQNKAQVSGLTLGAATGKFTLRDVSTVNCSDAGMHGILYDGAQFVEAYGVQTNSNYVGLKIYSTVAGGGGNSNSFYGLQAVNNVVGVLQAPIGTWPQGQNYFFNPTINGNSLAAFAVFSGTLHLYGGAPEANAQGSIPSATIDGFTVKRATLYANKARVFFTDVEDQDARTNPLYVLESHTTLSLLNSGGYGNTGGTAVSADSTSKVLEEGSHGYLGTMNGVAAWPSSLYFGTSWYTLAGSPITTTGSDIPNAWSANSFDIPFGDINGSLSQQPSHDPLYGAVNSVTHASSVGTQESNRVRIGTVIPALSQTSDMVISVLLKANKDCAYSVGAYGGYVTKVSLAANTWTRVLLVAPQQPSGTGVTLVAYPADSTGPTVSWTRLMAYAGPAGPATQQIIARIAQTGYIYVPGSAAGITALSSGTATVSTPAACAPGSTCVYKLTNCGKSSSTAIGALAIGTVKPGTSFQIISLNSSAAIVAGDASTVCWQIN